ncbi:MAG: DUF1566 domain-containing protein [Rhodothermaceae bacterium]
MFNLRNCKFLLLALLVTAAFGQTYKVVDTGQTLFFNNNGAISAPLKGEAFFGQDAGHTGYQPDYTLSGDGLTVYDNITGLTWIRSGDTDNDGDIDVDDKIAYSQIQSYINLRNSQNFGGYNDWRLPTMKELYSLMNFNGTDPSPEAGDDIPFINTDYFIFEYGDVDGGDREIDAQYWSDNIYTGKVLSNFTGAFGLNLADGRIKCYPNQTPNDVKRVMLVRGNTDYGINNFTDNNDETITDNATGLMWTKNDFGNSGNGPRSGVIWQEALALVQQKNDENYLGYNDWRLPNAKEMQSIVDYSRGPDISNSASIDPLFNTTQITNEGGETDYPWFWTSTTHIKTGGLGFAAVYITFGRATGYWQNEWKDVHGAGCQRSDLKNGDFTNYTFVNNGYYFGNAPQGDASRSYNYVRLVRNVENGTTSVDENSITPENYKLDQNYPNPFNPSTKISFSLPEETRVSLKIFNLIGEVVKVLVDEELPAGQHTYQFDASDMMSGVYFYTIVTSEFTQTRKMILLK